MIALAPPLLAGLAALWVGWLARPNFARQRVARTLRPVVLEDADSGSNFWGLAGGRAIVGTARAEYRTAIELSTIIDIVLVAVASGLSIQAALLRAARGGPERLGEQLARLLEADLPLAEALDEFGRLCGRRAGSFVEVLASSIRYGIELTPALERLQRDLRLETRRSIDKRTRRLPVLMLFPLIFCVLPALGLVAVVPVLVAAFQL